MLRHEIEDFLYAEAALLDEWRLDEWLGMLTEDVTYIVPATDARDADPTTTLSIIADDAPRLRARAEQLLGKHAWAEHPPSRTRRLITNVRIRRAEGATIAVTANFAVYRFRGDVAETFVGRYEYTLVRREDGLKIQVRKAILDLEALRPHGKLSIIL
ncbi:MAG TPA: aromatic-ring-hydroxylating dioxygenase subunit beta [Kofleriaceae bacterium]